MGGKKKTRISPEITEQMSPRAIKRALSSTGGLDDRVNAEIAAQEKLKEQLRKPAGKSILRSSSTMSSEEIRRRMIKDGKRPATIPHAYAESSATGELRAALNAYKKGVRISGFEDVKYVPRRKFPLPHEQVDNAKKADKELQMMAQIQQETDPVAHSRRSQRFEQEFERARKIHEGREDVDCIGGCTVMHKGGLVRKTKVYKLQKGELVIPKVRVPAVRKAISKAGLKPI